MKIGVLALQGATEPHRQRLASLGADVISVKSENDLENLSGLILPGGESTTLIHLLKTSGLRQPLIDFVKTHPTWGVCAGAILLAKVVMNPRQESLGLMDITVERNAYGRQLDSFIGTLTPVEGADVPDWETQEGLFIRAPKITQWGSDVRVLFKYRDAPVMVREKGWIAATFHAELATPVQIHEFFLQQCTG